MSAVGKTDGEEIVKSRARRLSIAGAVVVVGALAGWVVADSFVSTAPVERSPSVPAVGAPATQPILPSAAPVVEVAEPPESSLRTTAWFEATREQPSEGGDGDGFERRGRFALETDGRSAADVDSGTAPGVTCYATGKDAHVFSGFGLAAPAPGAILDGLQVRVRASADTEVGQTYLCVELSWDGGQHWTFPQRINQLTRSSRSLIAGLPTERWGHDWLSPELVDGRFAVRIVGVADDLRRDIYLDGIAVRLVYH